VSAPLEPAALLEACRSAPPAERAAAYQDLGRRMYRLLWPRVRHDPALVNLAEDSVQDALVKVWRALEAGRGPDHPDRFVSWAGRVAANTLVSELRKVDPSADVARPKRVGLRRQDSLEAALDPETGPSREPADTGAGPEEQAEGRQLAEVLVEIHDLSAVSAASRTVLLRGYLAEWDDDELAEHLGVTRANVHVIRCRDLAKLRADEGYMARLRAAAGRSAAGPPAAST
jgi:RNA polymerase sigma factor (sigma-70 family)